MYRSRTRQYSCTCYVQEQDQTILLHLLGTGAGPDNTPASVRYRCRSIGAHSEDNSENNRAAESVRRFERDVLLLVSVSSAHSAFIHSYLPLAHSLNQYDFQVAPIDYKRLVTTRLYVSKRTMPLRRTPPPNPSSPVPAPSAQSSPPLPRYDSEPNLSGERTSSALLNAGMRKRKREDECLSKNEILDMFSNLKLEQEKKFDLLLETMRDIKKQNTDIHNAMTFLSQKYDDLLNKVTSLEAERKLDHQNIKSLEIKIEYLEKKWRSSWVEIRNVPKKPKETKNDLSTIVNNLGIALNLTLQSGDIKDIYRVNSTKNSDMTPILLECSSQLIKEEIIRSVKAYNKQHRENKLNTSNLKMDGPSKPIYVAESLSSHTRRLYYLAREYAKTNKYAFCWTSKGTVYLRKNEGAPLIRVNNEADLVLTAPA
ncbi:unnamed protein product [Chilo suppressalis]|uniref:FP protein C-terminal domain-containing protein n=1 Tax=Chilo suppressalis TaxID=168631 RepID=A0ABN8APU9_CHISP|nr:unnamed protein product [Chilo suppressalis]